MKKIVFIVLFAATLAEGQSWNSKTAAVVLTYDDAIDIDIDHVAPALDSFKLKGTFYLTGASPVTAKRMEEWRAVARNGHELGNHSLFHPCTGGEGRGFITAETDLRNYTVSRAVREIRLTNTLLTAIDGKHSRTFAYPCSDTKIGTEEFYKGLTRDFAGARGGRAAMNKIAEVNLDEIDSYVINGQDAAYMIDLVKKAVAGKSLLVFMFHGVGGGHNLNVDRKAHTELLRYLKANEKDIWVATMVDVAEYIRKSR